MEGSKDFEPSFKYCLTRPTVVHKSPRLFIPEFHKCRRFLSGQSAPIWWSTTRLNRLEIHWMFGWKYCCSRGLSVISNSHRTKKICKGFGTSFQCTRENVENVEPPLRNSARSKCARMFIFIRNLFYLAPRCITRYFNNEQYIIWPGN